VSLATAARQYHDAIRRMTRERAVLDEATRAQDEAETRLVDAEKAVDEARSALLNAAKEEGVDPEGQPPTT
jgi:hypothetical protein